MIWVEQYFKGFAVTALFCVRLSPLGHTFCSGTSSSAAGCGRGETGYPRLAFRFHSALDAKLFTLLCELGSNRSSSSMSKRHPA